MPSAPRSPRRGLALSGGRLDNQSGSSPMARSLSDLHEETLVGKTGNGDQGGDCARSPETSPDGCHAPAARGRPAPAESGRAARDARDSAPERERLEAPHGGDACHPTRLAGGREGRAPLTAVHRELAPTPWAQPDGPRASGGCERARGGPLGGRRIDAHRAEPRALGGLAETGEARGQGVTRPSRQRDGIGQGSHSQASREDAPPKVEEIGGCLVARRARLSLEVTRHPHHVRLLQGSLRL